MIDDARYATQADQVQPGSTPSLHLDTGTSYSRRRFLELAAMTGAGVALSSCSGPQPKPSPIAREKVQLVYQDWRTDWFPPMVQGMLEQFHAANPGISVFFKPEPEYSEDKMPAELQAGTAADVFQSCCTHFPTWAQKGYLLDLRPYVAADLDQATIQDWDQAQYRSFFTRDGRQFGLPKYSGALALYYNKDLFDQYGVDYPTASWDHDDYLLAMKRLTRDRNGDGRTDLWGSMVNIYWDRIQMHVNGWGGHFVNPTDPSRCLMSDPAALAAMEWLRARMWDDKVMATTADVERMWTRDAFAAGRIAMVEDGSWALKDILTKADFRVGVAPLPAGPARRVTLATTDGFGIYAGTKHPDAAWELVKFLISKEYGRAMAKAKLIQPARASLMDDWVRFLREELPQKAADVDIAVFAEGHVKGYSVTAEIFPNMAAAERLANAAWEKIFTLGQSPVDLMKATAREIEDAQRSGISGSGP